MKFYRTILKTAVAALAAIATFACQKGDENGLDPDLNNDLAFEITIEDITISSAKVKVTHNGEKSDPWFGFLTDEVDIKEDKLISRAVEEYMSGDAEGSLHRSKDYVEVLKDLEPGTTYKYIAVGLSADGKVYGKSASAEFDTKSIEGGSGDGGEVNGMKLNKAWTVNYVGAGVLYDQDFDHVVTVNSTDRNTYAITVVNASLWDVNLLYDMAVLFADEIVASVEDYNSAYGTSYTVADVLYSGTASDAFDLYPGYYMAVALGINADGSVSGLYAVSDVFEVKEAIPTEEYKAWLGDWTVVGQNSVSFDITIARHENNRSFWVYGWEGFDDLPIDVEYSKERNDLTFYAQLVAENYYCEALDEIVNMYFLASDKDNQFYDLSNGEYGIAIAGVLEDGQRALVRYGVNVPNYPKFETMSYAAEVNGQYTFFTDTAELPSFRSIAAINPVAYVAKTVRKAGPPAKFIRSIRWE